MIVPESKVTPAKVEKNRVPASAVKNGYFVFANACDMKSSPSTESKSVGNVAKGKKLWLDSHNSEWFKAESRQTLENELRSLIEREWQAALANLTSLFEV